MNTHRYAALQEILDRAFVYASEGKGEQRHGRGGIPWTEQRHVAIGREVGAGFAKGQAAKKVFESGSMDKDAAVRELLGAITYIASAIHLIETGARDDGAQQGCPEDPRPSPLPSEYLAKLEGMANPKIKLDDFRLSTPPSFSDDRRATIKVPEDD